MLAYCCVCVCVCVTLYVYIMRCTRCARTAVQSRDRNGQNYFSDCLSFMPLQYYFTLMCNTTRVCVQHWRVVYTIIYLQV